MLGALPVAPYNSNKVGFLPQSWITPSRPVWFAFVSIAAFQFPQLTLKKFALGFCQQVGVELIYIAWLKELDSSID